MKHIVAEMMDGTDGGSPSIEAIRGLGLSCAASPDGEMLTVWCAHSGCEDADTNELAVSREDLQRIARLAGHGAL